MRAAVFFGLAVGLALGACGQSPSSVRLQIGLGSDAAAAAAGPTTLDVYTAHGRLFDHRVLNGTLPGDVVVLVDDDAGDVRALATVMSFAAAGKVTAIRGREVSLSLTLGAGPLPDSDGDGVPDVIDDCPGSNDPMQTGCQGDNDLAMPATDDMGVDLAVPDGEMGGAMCGNGVVEAGEDCDTGTSNSDNAAAAATCTTKCKKRATCGTVTGSTVAKVDPASGHCYVVWPTAVAWANGERDCSTRGGHLAAITSKAEDDFVKAMVSTPSWIGVVSAPAAASVTWSNGEVGTYGGFAAGGQGMGASACVVQQAASAGWTDRECSWPEQGNLPVVTVNNAGYVCEHACGNGAIEAGEECDPPAAGTCNASCRKIRACTEAGGMNSPASGFCYFRTAVADTFTAAQTACPVGTHLATPNAALETETAMKVINADSWIGVEAPTTLNVYKFDGAAPPPVQLDRYHGFAAGDPDQVAAPQCLVISYMHAGADGWRDRTCDAMTLYQAICERD